MDLQAIMPLILAAGSIVLVDIVLSGDNALVIGAAAGRLPRAQRLQAILWGGVGAVVFRAVLAIGATELLLFPLLQAIGGVVLVVIAVRLLLPESDESAGAKRQSEKLLPAIITILVADLTMSLDNVLAVGALAHGNLPLLVVGLLFSMTLLFVASALVAQLISRFTWLLDLAAGVLAYTAASLIIEDPIVAPLLHLRTPQGATTQGALALQVGLVAAVLA
ncbi:MAG: YjbE family putative metal transport protein, partial [Ktedonobacterales bacterium]